MTRTIPAHLSDDNLILDTDSYKSSHFLQYPPGTTRLFSYLESRGGRYPVTRFFGLQYILDRYLTRRVTTEMVDEARALIEAHGEPFPYDGWMRAVNVHAASASILVPNRRNSCKVCGVDGTA